MSIMAVSVRPESGDSKSHTVGLTGGEREVLAVSQLERCDIAPAALWTLAGCQ